MSTLLFLTFSLRLSPISSGISITRTASMKYHSRDIFHPDLGECLLRDHLPLDSSHQLLSGISSAGKALQGPFLCGTSSWGTGNNFHGDPIPSGEFLLFFLVYPSLQIFPCDLLLVNSKSFHKKILRRPKQSGALPVFYLLT